MALTRRARNFFALRVEIAAEAAEAVGEVMRSKAKAGLIEEQDAKKRTAALTGFFSTKREADKAAAAVEESLRRLQGQLEVGKFSVTRRAVRTADWEREWRKSWTTIEAAPGLVIKPTWSRRKRRPGEVVIELYPNAAFGTGEHPTTLQCLRAIESYMRPGWEVLDVGAGSGILAIAAAKLGASRVVAVDNDIRALHCARENVQRNGVQDTVVLIASHLVSAARFQADFLVANLAAGPLEELADSCGSALRAGGIFVAAGITSEKAGPSKSSFSQRGLAVIERMDEQGWTAFVCCLGNRR